jgi:hypothetical protein
MARLIGPDDSVRMLVLTTGTRAGTFIPPGTAVPLYADDQASVPADVLSTTDSVIAGSPAPEVMVNAFFQVPLFKYPNGVDVVYTRVLGGPVVPLYARTDDRLDTLEAAVAGGSTNLSAETAARIAGDTASVATAAADATTKANTAQASATSAASSDATTKANTAQSAAISAAAADATTKANAAQAAAIAAGIGAAAGLAIALGGI